MDIRPIKTEVQQNFPLEDKTHQLSKKVWDIDNRKTKIVSIPEHGIDYKMVNSMPNGSSFIGVDFTGNTQSYSIINGKILKSSNLTEA